MNNSYLKSKLLAYIDQASLERGYGIKEIQVHNENSPAYCIDLAEHGALKNYYGKSLFTASTQDLVSSLKSLDCISKVDARKVFPSRIQLTIFYQEPIAIWRDKKEFYFVTSGGSLMNILHDKYLNNFVLILGVDAPRNVPELIKFISQDPDLYAKIDRAAWIGSRRWNIIFQDGRKILLPEERPEGAWNKFVKLQRSHPDFMFDKYKTIDFRVPGKVYAS